MDRMAGIAQAAKQRPGPLDSPNKADGEIAEIKPQKRAILGIWQFRRQIGKTRPAIGAQVAAIEIDPGEEIAHRRLAAERIEKRRHRIPVDQNIADIENDGLHHAPLRNTLR